MMTNKAYDVVVIGAGVIGSSTAYHLVKKGLSVALVATAVMRHEAHPATVMPWRC